MIAVQLQPDILVFRPWLAAFCLPLASWHGGGGSGRGGGGNSRYPLNEMKWV